MSKRGCGNVSEAVTSNQCVWLLRCPLFPRESGLLNRSERLGYSGVKCQSEPGLWKGLGLQELWRNFTNSAVKLQTFEGKTQSHLLLYSRF